ncbi:MAG: NAD(P)-dependent oxidoreductase [Betaproteobacteria bacterium]|nr:NAD(P)-dependent oxidoreductase [Betaproteobacteria bacterium]
MNPVLAADLEIILQRTPEVWRELRGASIFMTGGTGWLGRTLIESVAYANRVADAKISITLLTRSPQNFAAEAPHLGSDPRIRLHQGDVKDFIFPEGQFSHVIHGAATSATETFSGHAPMEKFETLYFGTQRVLEFCKQSGARHLLFTSSGVAYGTPSDDAPIPEEYAGAPDTCDLNTALGQGKRAAEFLCSAYGADGKTNVTIARCFSFVGPFMPLTLHYALGNFINSALEGNPIIIKGDGSPRRSYMYTADMASWILTLLIRSGNPRIFNVGSSDAITIKELAKLVMAVVTPKLELIVLGQTEHSIGNPNRNNYVPSILRANREQRLEIWTQLETAVEKTVAFFRTTKI